MRISFRTAQLEVLFAQPADLLALLRLYRSGRQADALERYRDARRVLIDQLGIEPGPTLRELERAILAQDPALQPPPRGSSVDRVFPRRAGPFVIVPAFKRAPSSSGRSISPTAGARPIAS